MIRTKPIWCMAVAIGVFSLTQAASAVTLKVTIESLVPDQGVLFTPVWVGFHDGSFDVYDRNVPASNFPGLESIAEDGNTGPISGRFASEQSASGGVDGTVLGLGGGVPGPLDPGEMTMQTFDVDPSAGRYFSYASMIIPSNDAFVANGNPLAHEIFDANGNFLGADFIVLGADVLDAGTEQNTEMNAAFINQTAPNQGPDENGNVILHPGFNGSSLNPNGTPLPDNPNGTPIILGGLAGPGNTILIDRIAGDFTRDGFQVARFRVEVIPEPVTASMSLIGLSCLAAWTRRRRMA